MITLRSATVADTKPLGPFMVKAWREGFAGIVPAETLAREDADETASRCAKHIADPTRLVIVALDDEALVGACFAIIPEAGKTQGEIKSLFVDQAHLRRGIGRALMARVAQGLLSQGATSLTLGVFRDNASARRFYEAMGGSFSHERLFDWDGQLLPEVHYRFSDLAALARQA